MQAVPRFTSPAFLGPRRLRPRSINSRLPAKQGKPCSRVQGQSHCALLDSAAGRHGVLIFASFSLRPWWDARPAATDGALYGTMALLSWLQSWGPRTSPQVVLRQLSASPSFISQQSAMGVDRRPGLDQKH